APAGSFRPTGSMGTPREGAVAAPLPDGRALVAGGFNLPDDELASAEVFYSVGNTFSSAGIGAMGSNRADAAGAPLPDGRVLVAGGYNGPAYQTAEVFNPSTEVFTSAGIGAMSTARQGAAA